MGIQLSDEIEQNVSTFRCFFWLPHSDRSLVLPVPSSYNPDASD